MSHLYDIDKDGEIFSITRDDEDRFAESWCVFNGDVLYRTYMVNRLYISHNNAELIYIDTWSCGYRITTDDEDYNDNYIDCISAELYRQAFIRVLGLPFTLRIKN